jgi:hypothetical protein
LTSFPGGEPQPFVKAEGLFPAVSFDSHERTPGFFHAFDIASLPAVASLNYVRDRRQNTRVWYGTISSSKRRCADERSGASRGHGTPGRQEDGNRDQLNGNGEYNEPDQGSLIKKGRHQKAKGRRGRCGGCVQGWRSINGRVAWIGMERRELACSIGGAKAIVA